MVLIKFVKLDDRNIIDGAKKYKYDYNAIKIIYFIKYI